MRNCNVFALSGQHDCSRIDVDTRVVGQALLLRQRRTQAATGTADIQYAPKVATTTRGDRANDPPFRGIKICPTASMIAEKITDALCLISDVGSHETYRSFP